MTQTQLSFVLTQKAIHTYGKEKAQRNLFERSNSRKLKLVSSSPACQGALSLLCPAICSKWNYIWYVFLVLCFVWPASTHCSNKSKWIFFFGHKTNILYLWTFKFFWSILTVLREMSMHCCASLLAAALPFRSDFSIKWWEIVGPAHIAGHIIRYRLSTCCFNELIPLKLCPLYDKEDA